MSWLQRPESETRLLKWWESYGPAHYEMSKMMPVMEPVPKDEAGGEDDKLRQRGYLMLYQRKNK